MRDLFYLINKYLQRGMSANCKENLWFLFIISQFVSFPFWEEVAVWDGMGRERERDAPRYLTCRLLAIPFLYLGLPIGANPRRSDTWDPIVKKCERKLTKWKQKLLSFGGRVTLIKSVLNSIPIYFLSFFRAPNKILDKLVWIQ